MRQVSEYFMSKFPLPEGVVSSNDYLLWKVSEGAEKLYGKLDRKTKSRIQEELSFIEQHNLADYFLVVADYVGFLRRNFIAGPGRGSCASSIVSYCLGITEIDPLKYGLLFERFICDGRSYFPDIDIDTDFEGQKHVVGYLIEKCGFHHVAKIKNHACGIVISPIEIDKAFPTTVTKLESGCDCLVIDAPYMEIEESGFLKFDILCLEHLELIKQIGKELDVKKIPLDDEETLRLFREGRTQGIPMFESSGIRRLLREHFQDATFNDLVALNTLYRPGLENLLQTYLERRENSCEIKQPFRILDEILDETNGIFIYQEQVMYALKALASFSPSESNDARKALGKRQQDKILQYKEKFINGGKKNGYNQSELSKLFDKWTENGLYLFNKSHMVCYTMLSFQIAYLSVHYPEQFKIGQKTVNVTKPIHCTEDEQVKTR